MKNVVRTLLVAGLMLFSAGLAQAEELTTRCYLVPRTGTGHRTAAGIDAYRSAYVRELGMWFADLSYGNAPAFFVCSFALDSQHEALASNLDVIALPVMTYTDLNNAVTPVKVSPTALTTIDLKLEGLKIPVKWVTADTTWHEVAEMSAGVFFFAQRFEGLQGNSGTTFYDSDITLDSTADSLTANQRNQMNAVPASLGFNMVTFQGSMTVREYLQAFNIGRRQANLYLYIMDQVF